MKDAKTSKPAFSRYILLLLVAVLVVYGGSGFVRQAQVREQQRAQLALIQKEIALAQDEAAALEEHLEFVESSAAVEAWALENGWARPDEMPVVLVEPPGEPAAAADATDEPAVELQTPRQAWWNLFFGDR